MPVGFITEGGAFTFRILLEQSIAQTVTDPETGGTRTIRGNLARSSVFVRYGKDLPGAPLTILSTGHFRDFRGPNSIGWTPGNRLVVFAEIDPDDGTSAVAQQGSTVLNLINFPDSDTNFANSVPYSPALTGSWDIIASNGLDATFATTNVVGNVGQLPLVRNLRVSFASVLGRVTPTFEWDVPVGSAEPFTQVMLGFFDDRTNFRLRFLGGSFFESGGPALRSATFDPSHFTPGVPYVFRVMLVNSPGGIEVNRSTTFLNFTLPAPAGTPPPGFGSIFLPTVDSSGTYNFDCDVVDGQMIYIDPPVAIGYTYEIGTGNPNFASVLLPEIGDNVFTVEFANGSGTVTETVIAGTPFVFPVGGVNRFTVLGIEPTAGLDPDNVTAFITGLTFTGTGQFTGTMTPVTLDIEQKEVAIKSGVDPNKINPNSKGVIPVTILTTESFDATTVDPLSVRFGPNRTVEAHGRGHIEDADGDGDLDLVLHFKMQDTGIACGQSETSLFGETFDGTPFTGSDSIVTVGCNSSLGR
jgi:hypothetical protein